MQTPYILYYYTILSARLDSMRLCSIVLHDPVLYCAIPYYIVTYYTLLYPTTLYHATPYRGILHSTLLHFCYHTTLYHTTLYFTMLTSPMQGCHPRGVGLGSLRSAAAQLRVTREKCEGAQQGLEIATVQLPRALEGSKKKILDSNTPMVYIMEP